MGPTLVGCVFAEGKRPAPRGSADEDAARLRSAGTRRRRFPGEKQSPAKTLLLNRPCLPFPSGASAEAQPDTHLNQSTADEGGTKSGLGAARPIKEFEGPGRPCSSLPC